MVNGAFYRPERLAQRSVHGAISQECLTSIGVNGEKVRGSGRERATKGGHTAMVTLFRVCRNCSVRYAHALPSTGTF